MVKIQKYFWLVSLLSNFYFSCSPEAPTSIASVGNINILFNDYENKYQKYLTDIYQIDNLQNRQNFLNTIIDETLILKHANQTGLIADVELKRTLEKIHNQVLLNHYYEKKIKPYTQPTDIELRKIFSWYKTELHVKHIYAQSLIEANKFHQLLKNGTNWDDLAAQTFKDQILKENGGNLGWRKMGELDPSFEVVAYSLNDGEISHPVKTETGYSIIQVIERKKDLLLTENEFQREIPYIKMIAENYKKMPLVREVTDRMKSQLNIKYNLEKLTDFYSDLRNEDEFYPSSEEIVLTYKDQSQLSESDIFGLLNQVSQRQYKKLNSIENLESIISGLLVRKELIIDAQRMNIQKTKSFISESIEQQKRATVKYVLLKEFYDGENPDKNPFFEDPKKYQTFRDSIANEYEIIINHDLLKSFVLPIREKV